MSAPTPTTKLTSLAKKTGLAISPNAQLLGMEEEDRGEQYLRAQMVLSAKDWAALSPALPIARDSMDPGTGGFLGQDEDWWDPHKAPGLRTGQIERSPGVYLNIGIDDSDPNAVRIYIVQHGT